MVSDNRDQAERMWKDICAVLANGPTEPFIIHECIDAVSTDAIAAIERRLEAYVTEEVVDAQGIDHRTAAERQLHQGILRGAFPKEPA